MYEVHKYEYPAPLAEGRCSCGRDIRYNLTVPVIAHTDDGSRCPGDVAARDQMAAMMALDARLDDWAIPDPTTPAEETR